MKRRVWQTILAAACLLSLSLTGVVWAAPEAAKEAAVGENMAEETAAEQSPVKLTTREITIMVLEPDEEAVFPENARQVVVNIDGNRVTGYLQGENDGFRLFYGMNESGQKHVYRYDLEERTIQRYVPDSDFTQQMYDNAMNRYDHLADEYSQLRRLFVMLALASALR